MPSPVLRALIGAAAIFTLLVPAAHAGVGPDYVSSDNITHMKHIKTVGDGVGGRIVGDYLYVTSTKSLSIWDIKKDPANPQQVGNFVVDVEWENEEVPTNGKVLGMSAEIGCKDPLGVLAGSPAAPSNPTGATHCINLYDVSDKANPKFLNSVVGAGNHVSACVLDCQYMWGDNGPITDIRDPKKPKIIGDWIKGSGTKTSCHAVREVAPGIIFGACQPIVLLSVRPEHGGSITKPVVLSTAKNTDNRFIHSNRWPREAKDKFALVGGETNAPAVLGANKGSYLCDDTVAAFMVWDTTPALNPDGTLKKGGTFKMLDEQRPRNGTYADGRSPYNGLGCSVHWFTEHPEFQNGGLVAVAEYENGTRLKQIQPNGKIVEQGYFLPLGGSTSAPHFHPNGQYIYAIDYARGIDVLKYTGPSYRGGPDAFNPGEPTVEPNRTPGTQGKVDEKQMQKFEEMQKAEERSTARDCNPIATTASAKGRGRGLALSAAGAKFDAQVFQLSKGRNIIKKRRVTKLTNVSGTANWNGKTARKKTVANGYYLVRITTGGKTRQLVFERRGGKFVARKDFQTGSSCEQLRSFQLRSPVFGGKKNVGAAASFRLTRDVSEVVVDVLRNGKVVSRRRVKAVKADKTYKVTLPAKKVKRGVVTVRLTALTLGRTILVEGLEASRL